MSATIPDALAFCCPRCKASLTDHRDSLRCPACAATYPVRSGIVDFRSGRHDYYFNPVPLPAMNELTRGMGPDNWPATIHAFLRHARGGGAAWLDNLVVDSRYAWKLFLPLTPGTRVLDLGCGLGNLTKNIAPHVGTVYAADLTYARLEFSQKRFALFNAGQDIVLLAAGDGAYLPFPDKSLDWIVLSGVLEWVGEGDTAPFAEGRKLARLARMLSYHFGRRGPGRIQLALLREIRRIVKDDGGVFIAIENRLNYEYFRGRPDHHSGLLYGSLMPRLLANVYSILIRRAPYRTYTYSLPGYKRLLHTAGFPYTEFLGFAPGYSNLEEIMPAEVAIPNWTPEVPANLKERIRRHKSFVPAYGIIARLAPPPWRRLQDAVLDQIERQLAQDLGDGRLTLTRYLITSKDKLLITARWGTHEIIIKIPQNAPARANDEQNALILTALRASRPDAAWCPRLLMRGEADGLAYFVEDCMSGTPASAGLTASRGDAFLADVEALLDIMNPSLESESLETDSYERHVTSPLRALFRLLPDTQALGSLESFFHEHLYGARLAVGLEHGDFSLSNLLMRDGRVAALIDWDTASLRGLPIVDAITVVESMHRLFNPTHRVAQSIPLLASGRWPRAAEWTFLLRRHARHGTDPRHHEALVYLKWLHDANSLLKHRLGLDPAAVRRFVHDVLNQLPSGSPVRP